MRGTAPSRTRPSGGPTKTGVVTSGRLSGRVKVQSTKRRLGQSAAAAAPRPEPAYSLYSTDSEDQVSSLHKGLDRCAALLGNILQAETKEALPSVPARALKVGAPKSKPSTSQAKKTSKTAGPQSDPRGPRSVQPAAGSRTPKTPHRSAPVPAAHSGVKLHPPHKHTSSSAPPPKTPTLPPPQPDGSSKVPPPAPQTGREPEPPEEDEMVPVRDVDPQSKPSDAQLELLLTTRGDKDLLQDQREGTAKTVQDLLGELRALIAGPGSAAEVLLGHLEQTVTSSSSSNLQTEAALLQRCLQEPEEPEEHQDPQTLCSSEVVILQDQLAGAQSQLQELQRDLTELRQALRASEEKNHVLLAELEASRSRLLESEREKRELTSLAQSRLEEVQTLQRALQTRESSARPPGIDQNPAVPPTDRIKLYLQSLGQLDQEDPQASSSAAQLENHRRQLFGSAPSLSERDSLSSDWSVKTRSTFNTKDEAAFRDGLAALDASIASLQKTLQLDLRR